MCFCKEEFLDLGSIWVDDYPLFVSTTSNGFNLLLHDKVSKFICLALLRFDSR